MGKYKLYEMLSPYFSLIEVGAKTWSMMILANGSFLKISGSIFKASETTLVCMTEMRAGILLCGKKDKTDEFQL